MHFIDKIKKLNNKHDSNLFFNSIYELYIRTYTKPNYRKILQLFSIIRNNLPNKIVFLVGCYNSGTTILRDILKSHPDISGMPREGVKFTNVFPDMQEGGWIRMAYHNRNFPACFFSIDEAREILNRDWGFWADKGNEFFLEKSITHSFRIPFLKTVFPNACFIGITRDGYCSTEGILRRAKPLNDAAKALNSNMYPVELCAKQWVYINKSILRAQTDGVRIKHIKFEDFVSCPHKVLKDIFDFIGADTEYLSGKNNTVSILQKKFEIRNFNPESRMRFPASKVDEFNTHAGELMRYFGYKLM